MSTENETMGELIADWRKGRPVTADQIHTAWVREREALLKRARDNYAAGFAKGKEAADACMKPDPRWKERCEKCFENNACEPPECRYFDGEDCQSPIPGQHPMAQPGNVAALREALKYVLQFDATDEAAEEDGLTDAERIAEYADHIEECQKKARAALAEPPRNCDTPYVDRVEMYYAFKDWCNARGHTMEPKLASDAFDWLLAPAEEGAGK